MGSEGYGESKTQWVTLASKFYNRAVTLFSGICSPLAQHAGNNGTRDRDRWGRSHIPPSLPSQPHSGCFVWFGVFVFKKNERKRVCSSSFLPRLKAHFFLSSPGGALGRGWGCHDADGLYFDYGALVVMGDRRRGVATLCMCLYKSGTQTPKSLVIPWPKLIRTITDDGRCCSQLFREVTWTGMLQKNKKNSNNFFFLPP